MTRKIKNHFTWIAKCNGVMIRVTQKEIMKFFKIFFIDVILLLSACIV